MIPNINSPLDFAREIETLVEDSGMEYLEALIHYSESHDLEIETVASLAKQNPQIKALLAEECEAVNLVKKSARLPI